MSTGAADDCEDAFMTGLAQLERMALCTTLAQVGPDAPTLCEGWTARELAAHLVLRERRPDAVAAGLVPQVGVLADHSQRVQHSYAELAWPELVEMVRQGPPGWSPTRVPAVDDAINLAEFYVHHEDLLRAAAGWAPTQARQLKTGAQNALWTRLRQAGQLLFRRSPVGVVLEAPDHGSHSVHRPTKLGTAVLIGSPQELLLFGFGRKDVAVVEIDGDPDAVEGLRGANLSL